MSVVTTIDQRRAPDNRRERPRATRFLPPRLAENFVERPRLTRDLAAVSGIIRLFAAPPGSGKTMVLAQHYAALAAEGRGPRWLSLSTADNDPARLMRNLAEAFPGADDLLQSPPPGCHIFLDGLERITDAAPRRLVETFMLGLPESSTCYATTHRLRGPVLQDGRLRGMIRVTDYDSLRLTDDEALGLLGPDWSPRNAERLNAMVNGWAAGLRFMTFDSDAAQGLIDDPAGFTAPIPPALADYFEDTVCAHLGDGARSGLMDASVLDRFTAEALAAMPGKPCAWRLIEAHIGAGPFIDYLDDKRQWVAFHSAFGRYLRQRLQRNDPARFEEVQRFAASWFQAHGFAAEAMRHAAKLTDPLHAARLMEDAGALHVELRDGSTAEYGQPITAELAGELPLVFLGRIYLQLRTGHLAEARAAFEQMRVRTRNFTVFGARANETAAAGFSRMMEMVLDVSEDRPIDDAQIDSLEQALASYLGSEPILAGGVASLLAMAYICVSRYAEAATVADIGMNALRDFGATKVSVFLRVHQAGCAMAHDTLDKAVLYIEDALRLAQVEGVGDSYEVLATQILRAELHYENNEIEEARRLLDPALGQIHAMNGWFGLYVAGFGTAAAIGGIADGFEAANRWIVAAESMARHRNLPRLAQFAAIVRLRELVRARDWRSASELLEREPLRTLTTADSLSVWEMRLQVPALLEAARLMIDLGRCRDAALYLERVNKAYLDDADVRLRFTFRVLAMRVAYGLRRYNAAFDHLQVALGLALHSGLMRRAVNNRLHLIEVFDWSLRNGRQLPPRVMAFVDEVLRHADPSDSGSALLQRSPRRRAGPVARNFVLSPRETEIIALVAEGYLTKEIAFRLAISEGTVKSHRKRIHEKLGVSSRSQAILRARELLII